MKSILPGTILFILFCFLSSVCQNISLSGKVLDGENNPLGQATVLLVNEDITVITDAQGTFAITGTSVDQEITPCNVPVSILITNGTFTFTPEQSDEFELTVYDIKGSLQHAAQKRLIAHETFSLRLLPEGKSHGVYVISFNIGKRKYRTKYSHGLQDKETITISSGLQSSSGKRHLSNGYGYDWGDTLVFKKSGYVSQRWPIRKSDDTAVAHLVTPATYDIEMQMHELVNNHRAGKGLDRLQWNDVAANYVRIHSRNIAQGISPFGHEGFKEWRVPAIAEKIVLWEPTENVVSNYGVGQSSFSAWLSSSGHKENIENTSSNLTGIGYYSGSERFYNIYTQVFFFGILSE